MKPVTGCTAICAMALVITLARQSIPARLLAAEAEQAIAEGRKAFDTRVRYPWYDQEHDELRPIELARRREWNWTKFKLPTEPLKIIAWALIGLVLLLLVYLIARELARRAGRRTRSKKATHPLLAADQVEALPFLAERSRDDLLGQARRHYEQGNYGEAIVYLFSYELVELDRFSFIHLSRGKTNRQYLRELPRAGALKQLLEATMVRFEDVFFGSRPLDRASFEACWNRLNEFEQLVSQPR